MISKAEALTLIAATSRAEHARLVGSLMRRLARHVDADEETWELVGLLHDLDYDHTREDRRRHGIVASEQLRSHLDEPSLHAIRSHDARTGIKPKGPLAIGLIVADATAAALEQMDEAPSMETLRAKLDELAVATPWIPTLMHRCTELGVDFTALLTMAVAVRTPR